MSRASGDQQARRVSNMKVLVIPGLTFPPLTEENRERITKASPGSRVVEVSANQAIDEVHDADVVLGIVSREMFRRCEKLRWVHATASGIDMFLYPEFVDSEVLLTSEKGLVGEHLADHAFSLLLMLTRQTAKAYRLGADAWNRRPELRSKEIELTGLTMGCFGFGGTGKAVAKRAAAFGMDVIALDRDPVEPTAEVSEVWQSDQFDELLQQSDVLAICCPLTTETRGKFDRHAFECMKDTAMLVNVTRGEVMDEDALIEALETGKIAGVGLDVTPREPLPAESPLWNFPNVVMTPHTAGASQFRAVRNLDRFCANLERLEAGEPLLGLIDKNLGY